MKNLKTTILTVIFAICCFTNVNAQATEGKTRGKVVNPGPKTPRVIFSAGYGNTMPSSTTKDAYFKNSSGISGDLFVPFLLFRKGWDGTVKGGNYGFTIAGSYNFGGNGNPSVPLPAGYTVTSATSSGIVYRGSDPKNPGFRIGGGPQVNFYLKNRLLLSPMVLAEYFSVTQKELSAVQTTQVNGQTKEYNLLTLPETKISGFSVTPKLRISYFLAENFGIFADAGYVFGPKVNTQTTSLQPLGNPNQAGQYNQQQLDAGTQIKSEIKSTSYQAFAVNVGLSLAFGGKKGWNGMTKTDDKGWNGKTQTAEAIHKGWDAPPPKGISLVTPNSRGIVVYDAKGDRIQGLQNIDSKITEEEAQKGITFRWTPVLPKPQNTVTYKLKVWQLMQGQNSTEAMRSNQPIVTKDVDDVTETTISGIYTGPCKPPYLCDYVWAVEALENGKILDGSEPISFNIRKGWNGKTVDMIVPKTATTATKVDNIAIQGSGEFTKNGVPIVYGKIVKGTIKMGKGISSSGIEILIEQKESNDVSKAITDDKGNFIVKVAIDTVHSVSVNNVEYGKIKIVSNPSNDDTYSMASTDEIKKGWNGITLMSPPNNKKLNSEETKEGISFRWTPVMPKPTHPVTYRVRIWQLKEGQTAEQAMRDNQPETIDVNNETQAKSKRTGPCKPPYLCEWIWNVQALDKSGKTIGENQGTSELSSFSR